MFDKLHEECGIFGIYAKNPSIDVTMSTYFALYALQHRGQESCGIAVNDSGVITMHKECGLVPEVFNREQLDKLGHGQMAIGHDRYSTTGSKNTVNAQPLVIRHIKGVMALAHNGNISNVNELREKLELDGAIFHTTNDTEVIAYTITKERITLPSIEAAVESAMEKLKGAYSLVIMSPQKLIAARDPNGFRPLCMGKIGEDAIVFASETCALDSIGAEFVRDLDPGEIVIVDECGIRSIRTHCGNKGSLCVFEFVYFARPDSVIHGFSVHEARKRAGEFLAKEHPVDADLVIGVPDSGIDAAMGYAKESGIPYDIGFIKNRYIGRTFIQPVQTERETSVKIKLNVLSDTIKGKRVIMIDDSIVRGTTSAKLAKSLREAGAKEVHMRVSSPTFLFPCYFGTDIDSKENLIANRLTVAEIAKEIGVDSLGFLSIEGVNKIAEGASCGFCDGCFSGKYPVEVLDEMPKYKFEQKINQKVSKKTV